MDKQNEQDLKIKSMEQACSLANDTIEKTPSSQYDDDNIPEIDTPHPDNLVITSAPDEHSVNFHTL